MRYIITIILMLFCAFGLFAKTISPLNYGLQQAKTGEARFKVLYQTHEIAKKNGWEVSYKGISELRIEIPANAKSIPLGEVTDFSGTTLIVTNTKKNGFFLFELSQELLSVSVPKTFLGSYDFSSIKDLKHGYKLLVVEDKNSWVKNRAGSDYGATRKDVLLLKNGKALNKTIATYNNESSAPLCKYVEVTKEQKIISNITFKRTNESTVKTYLVQVKNMNNVLLQGIQIITPTPIKMDGDNAIRIYNCSNITLRRIKFNQTYSFPNSFGYGINMNNVWNSWFDAIESEANWGLFGNNNINTAHISNSKINRFDTHCYGKDFYFNKCEITQIGLPQSSFMGELVFTNCEFKNAYVCTARIDYNAYTPFSLQLINCTIHLDSKHKSLVYIGNVGDTVNKRKELRHKYSPSLYIKNTTVSLSSDVSSWSLIHVKTDASEYLFDFIGDIRIEGLRVIGSNSNLMLFDNSLRCRHSVNINMTGVDLIGTENNFQVQAQKKYDYAPTIVFNINKDGSDIYYISNSKFNYSPSQYPHYNLHFSNCSLGRIRFYNTKHGEVSTRRRYDNCILYLNDIDSDNYTLDDNADYHGCVFKPVNKKKKVVPITKNKSSVMNFENCSSDVSDLFGPKLPNSKIILKSYKFKFK